MNLLDETSQLDLEKQARSVWLFASKYLRDDAKVRVQTKVLRECWTLEKALQEEGILFCRAKLDTSELFLDGRKRIFV